MTTPRLRQLVLAVAVTFAAGACSAPAPEGTSVGERVPAFTAKVERFDDATPVMTDFDSHKTLTTTVYVVTSTQCPITNKYVERLRALETAYMPQHVDVARQRQPVAQSRPSEKR